MRARLTSVEGITRASRALNNPHESRRAASVDTQIQPLIDTANPAIK